MKKLIAGNWKMHGLLDDRKEIDRLLEKLKQKDAPACDILLCLPFTLLFPVTGRVTDGPLALGAQDCHFNDKGAHTGDISVPMVKETGATYVIVGHSERRHDHGEESGEIKRKAQAALRHGLTPIICVGETKDQREAGEAEKIVRGQLEQSVPARDKGEIVIAYEPVWAIGTGLTATGREIRDMHAFVRETLKDILGDRGEETRILYGGSVKPDNAKDILKTDNVDGVLVGGASLKADDFYAIISAAG